jgi:asparagine synthase (glutamine-hydrolysing)
MRRSRGERVMCGIAGVVEADPLLPIDDGPLWEAAKLLHHRGPDGAKVWSESGAGLSHTRLAIIDRAHGDQPMFSEDGRYAVVFNGEIYNHHDLRRELEGHGYRLRTRCDTEVLLYLYDWLGDAMVDRLRGMFAFAVLDRRERKALFARDRFGKKPLYFSEAGGSLRFASTLDALRPLLPATPDLDVNAIAQYLVLQYVPSPLTPYRGVHKLSPGHLVSWNQGRVDVRQYWQPPPRAVGDRPLERREATARVRELIGEAVRIRLESEVPLGVFLSGGLDSSIVVAEMAAAGVRPQTYSMGFRDQVFDETRYARLVADRFDTDHHELQADQSVEDTFSDFVKYYDEPFADSSALATLAVAKAASKHVTVILTGDGGDEMFGGYRRYVGFRRAIQIRSLLGPLAGLTAAALMRAGRSLRRSQLTLEARFVKEPWEAYRDRLFHFSPHELHDVFQPDLRQTIDPGLPVAMLDDLWRRSSLSVSALLWIDQQVYLPEDLLTKMDRATMAHSLEARSPLLDHVVADYCALLSDADLFEGVRGKAILRHAYDGVLPPQILSREKMGFGVPLMGWMREQLAGPVNDLLVSGDAPLSSLLQRDKVRVLVDRFMGGDDEDRLKVWNLLALAGWAAGRDYP